MTDNTQPQSEELLTETTIADNQEPLVTEQVTDDSNTDKPSIADLQAQITTLEKELGEARARANAELYNTQKRLENEAEKSKKYALEKFAKGLLEVVDNLERAIDSAKSAGTAEDDALLQGVELTLKSLLTVLEKHHVTVVNPVDEKFNADLHEAVGVDPEAEADTVGKVLQKGYVLQDRLLRPAMVMVGA